MLKGFPTNRVFSPAEAGIGFCLVSASVLFICIRLHAYLHGEFEMGCRSNKEGQLQRSNVCSVLSYFVFWSHLLYFVASNLKLRYQYLKNLHVYNYSNSVGWIIGVMGWIHTKWFQGKTTTRMLLHPVFGILAAVMPTSLNFLFPSKVFSKE